MYTVTYASFWFGDCELYTETKVCDSEEAARSVMKSYIEDIRQESNKYHPYDFGECEDVEFYCASVGGEWFYKVDLSVV